MKTLLLFEGEFLNGERLTGKEFKELTSNFIENIELSSDYTIQYESGNFKGFRYSFLEFEGEYLNGKRWNGNIYNYLYKEMYKLKEGNEIKKTKKKIKKLEIKKYLDIEKEDSYDELTYERNNLNKIKNGEGKEYDSHGNLIFKGQYLNDERQNGKIYEYDNLNNLIFEGDYSNRKIWNGKNYDKSGNLLSEIKDGNGIVREFYSDGYLKNEKVYINGVLKKVKEYIGKNELIFEGEYLNGMRYKGNGKEYDQEGRIIFEGEYLNGIRWKGKIKSYSKMFEDPNIILFEGECDNGKINGEGVEYYYNGDIKFVGEYLNGERWNGKYSFSSFICDINIAEIKEGKEMGNLLIYHDNGNKFIGEYKQFPEKRKGKEFDQRGKLLFEGEYNFNKPTNGHIIQYNDKGEIIFEGEIFNGNKNGKGKEYNKGKIIFEGEYINGKRKKKKK